MSQDFVRFRNLAIRYGGVSTEFEQGPLLANYHYIRGHYIGKRGVAAKAMVTSNMCGLEGVCFGLAMVLLECNFNFSKFHRLAYSPVGIGKVRGYMHLQSLGGYGADKLGKTEEPIYSNMNQGKRQAIFRNPIDVCTKILERDFANVDCFVRSANAPISSSASFFKRHPNTYFFMGIFGEGGHALAAVNTDDSFAVFDPNFGVAQFKKFGTGSTRNFCKFLDDYVRTLYYGTLSSSYEVKALKHRKLAKATVRLA